MANPVSFRYFKTSPEIIQLAVMPYVRFRLSLRNVEDLLRERGVDVSYESVRNWSHRFGSQCVSEIKKLFFTAKDRFRDRLVSFVDQFASLQSGLANGAQTPGFTRFLL